MKQTAVEWLVEQILQKVQNYEDGDVETQEEPFIIEYVNKYHFTVDLTKFVEQAKEMEKEQMRIISIDKELFKRLPIEGTNFCSFNVNDFRYFANKYYIDNFKETFKSE
jgi:hypothetical protein